MWYSSPTNAFMTPLPKEMAGVTWDGGPGAIAPLLVLSEVRPSVITSRGSEDTRRFTQTPQLDFSDEGCVAVTSNFETRFDASLEAVINPWVSFGPLAGPAKLINASLSYREFYPAAMGMRQVGTAPYFSVSVGTIATLFRQEISFQQSMQVQRLNLMHSTQVSPSLDTTTILLVTAAGATPRRLTNITGLEQDVDEVVESGGWWGLWSPDVANAQIFAVRGVALRIHISSPRRNPAWFTVRAASHNFTVSKGDKLISEFAQLGLSLATQLPDADALLQLQRYLSNPPITMHTGNAPRCSIICDSVVNAESNFTTDVEVPQYSANRNMMLPLRVGGLNPRWSVGLWQKYGFPGSSDAIYGNGTDRYTALGVHDAGWAYVPLYVGESSTRVVVGHPVIATGVGAEHLFIQTTHVNARRWHVHVSNPTNSSIRATVHTTMSPCGFALHSTTVELGGGHDTILL
jgi:hypothetical protein